MEPSGLHVTLLSDLFECPQSVVSDQGSLPKSQFGLV